MQVDESHQQVVLNIVNNKRKGSLSISEEPRDIREIISAVTPKLRERDAKVKKDASVTPKSLSLKSPKEIKKRADSVAEEYDSKEEEVLRNDEPDASHGTSTEVMTPRHGVRAAAALAKSKLSTRGVSNDLEVSKIEIPVSSDNIQAQVDRSVEFPSSDVKQKSGRKSSGSGSGSASKTRGRNSAVVQAVIEDKYVCCEKCEKWRRIPQHVNENELPDKWLCSMNIWDPFRNSCDTPEENFTETVAPTVEETGGSKIAAEDEAPAADHNAAIAELVAPVVSDVTKKLKLKKKKSTDDFDHENENDAPVPAQLEKESAKKKPRKSLSVDPTTPRAEDRSVTPAVTSDQWVQCDKCSKWRRVPFDVDVDQLPKVWYCHMNTWAVQYAKCGVVQEKTTKKVSTETADDAIPRTKLNRRSESISAPVAEPVSSTGAAATPPPAPVTKWIQCDRKNCQKWRKVAAYVDMDTMPDTW